MGTATGRKSVSSFAKRAAMVRLAGRVTCHPLAGYNCRLGHSAACAWKWWQGRLTSRQQRAR